MTSCPWIQFTEEVLALYSPPIRRIATYRKMRQVLGEFAPLCATTGDLTPIAVSGWITSHPERRPETTLSLLKTIRAACAYAMLRGYLESNPFAWRSPTAWVDWDVPELVPIVHTSTEIAAVLRTADTEALAGDWRAERLRALVYTLAFTGARKREVLGLRVEDINLAGGSITIRTNRRRGLKTRASSARLPIAPELRPVLEEWLPMTGCEWLFPGVRRAGPWLEGPIGQKALDQVEALGVRAFVEGLTIASFRHTFASLAEGWGISELALQRVLRHSSTRTQTYYRHELPEVLRDVAGKIHYGTDTQAPR